ncbi:fibronectin type III domain-containing protein [Streptomyces sp. A3M-1-3]|uniref:fibronectin type III domain-containing protein n=1 Tax=Streptomyces sp. A3M-1-3 TaxID=2962044 RepID=UPI0035ABD626
MPRLAALLRAASLTGAACLILAVCGPEERDSQSPPAPAGVTARAGSATSVHVMWDQAAGTAGVTGYEVFRGGERVKAVPGEKHMTDIEGLTPSTAYTFTVRARDAAGNVSPHSSAVPVTMPAPAVDDGVAPTPPTKLTGRADGARAATLAWAGSTDSVGVTSYDIYQSGTRIHSVSGSATAARVTGLRPDTVYTFTVRARDAGDNSSSASGAVDITTAPAKGGGTSTAPAEFRAVSVTEAGARAIELSWVPPRTDEAVEEYQMFLDGTLTTTIRWGAAPPAGRATYRFDAGDGPGATYRVKIRARLPDGNWGAFSAQRTVVLDDGGT